MGLLDMLGGSRGMSPLTMALLGVLAYRTVKGKGRLADILGKGDLGRSGLGGLAGAGGGGILAGGLNDLLDRFRQTGQSDKAQSWVDIGPNKPIAPHDLERALGEERIQWLMTETGMGRDELLTGLSGELPGVVDSLTPKGRIPADDEPIASRTHETPAPRSTVLVVEDEPMLLSVVAETLREAGYEVLEAGGGEAALQVLDQNPDIELLMTDIKMPGINGYQVVEKRLAVRPNLKVLMMTGYSKDPIPKQIVERGIPVLYKPFDFDKLPGLASSILASPTN